MGQSDAYIVVIDPSVGTGSRQAAYSSFIGSAADEWGGSIVASPAGRAFIGVQTANGPVAGVEDKTVFSNVALVLALDLLIPEARISLGGVEDSCVEQGTLLALEGGASSTPEGSALTGFSWRIGDSEPVEGAAIEHRLDENGLIGVDLTVTNDLGLAGSSGRIVCVRSPREQPELPVPWQAANIGEPRYAGVTSPGAGDGAFHLVAGGRGFFGMADSGHILFEQIERDEGDGAVSARLDAFGGGERLAAAGVILRTDLDADSPFAALVLERGRLRFAHRDERGALPRRNQTVADVAPPVRLRVRRESVPENDGFWRLIGEFSAGGDVWSEVGRAEIAAAELPAAMLAGAFAAGGEDARDATLLALEVEVSELRWTPESAIPAEPRFRRGDADSSGGIDITDAIALLACLFEGASCPECRDPADANDDSAVDISDPV
ncbi:MAG: PKD domain-containing protein, partial [Chloroflexi bacterium]|nr:PKD domain-containing protein [Chloroflexota bacterium]